MAGRYREPLEGALEAARRVAAGLSGPDAGMASISLAWNPYAVHWEAQASWSDDSRVVSEGADSPFDAVLSLVDILRDPAVVKLRGK